MLKVFLWGQGYWAVQRGSAIQRVRQLKITAPCWFYAKGKSGHLLADGQLTRRRGHWVIEAKHGVRVKG